tara:strand:- start:788 stop:1045 length:258 start_codon:yes stop_codon:yes gene_type:complete
MKYIRKSVFITESAQIIERIADCILEDHVEIMLENAALKACLREWLDEECEDSTTEEELATLAEVHEGFYVIWLKAWRLVHGGAR